MPKRDGEREDHHAHSTDLHHAVLDDEATFPQFGELAEDLVTDVVVVGADLAGVAGATPFQTSYVIAGRAPKGAVGDVLWLDTSDPYYCLRVEPRRDSGVVIFGGEDHKTGQQDDAEARYRRLESRLTRFEPAGQVISGPAESPLSDVE